MLCYILRRGCNPNETVTAELVLETLADTFIYIKNVERRTLVHLLPHICRHVEAHVAQT